MSIRVEPLEGGYALRFRDERVDLIAGNVVLLSSAALETEARFGELVKQVAHARRVLIGGLGFGATLRATLDAVGPDARVVVAERMPVVRELVAGRLSHLSGKPLDDARAEVFSGDVFDAYATGPYDAILLDVDNGPEWAATRSNARLYAADGLAAAYAAVSPGGVFAVWSGYEKDAFIASLRRAGFEASKVPLLERGVMRARAYVGRK
jgi:spermidine synthase